MALATSCHSTTIIINKNIPIHVHPSIRDEIVLLNGGFPHFWGHFCHFCDFPRSVIKVRRGGGWPLVKLYSHHYDEIDV